MPIQDWKKEIWTIPNMLSIFRLVLIPVYVYIYLHATETMHYVVAAAILAVSCLTDMVDGKIARRYNMISTLGKFLDPLADKCTQLALILCLAVHHPALWALLCLFVVKESFQLVMMLVNLRKGKALDGALMAGKVCTTVLFVSLIVMVLLPGLSETTTNVITGICSVFMCVSFAEYIRAYFGKNKKVQDLEK